ncbi:g6395 [Coccomyxa elongata]
MHGDSDGNFKGVSTRASPIEPTWSDASVLREESSETLKPDVGGGSGSGAGSIGRGGGGDGDGSEGNNNLPADLAAAVAAGKVSQEIVQRYLNLSTGLLAPLMKIGGFRDRLLADPSFLVKVGIEVGIGIFTKSSAEYAKRGENFNKELDFVLANVIMALVADFMLVWLPAPTLSFKPKSVAKSSGIMAFMASCPENAFQRVPPGYSPFTVGQRAGAVLRNGSKLLAVGFGASLFGVSVTNVLIALRQHLDPTWVPLNAPQNVLVTSAAYSSYMAVSSNLRYQIIAGIVEERGIEAIFASNPALCSALSFIVRTSNTFLGSLMWVDYLRLLGLQ